MLFDSKRKPVSLEDELKIFKEVQDHIREDYPYFEVKLIFCGLKIIGRPHIQKMIIEILESEEHSNMVTGFDLVNEEDFTPPILDFIQEIFAGKKADKKNGMPCFFHCGETHDRNNTNAIDALMLGSKRLGHGFQIWLHPKVMEQVQDRDICIEACPISNLLLGYCIDMRNHPARWMMTRGIQISISSDDPCFFGYDGVTMDYVYSALSWELDIRDLKKISLNGIKYASCSEEKKTELREKVFPERWNEFINYVLESCNLE